MAKFICKFTGVRGRVMKLYDTKVVIVTNKTVGSLLTGNITDGEKTIFLSDVVGVQFKRAGLLIGYLQFETPSLQMNNQQDNMFSENTFTFNDETGGVSNKLMEMVYSFVVNRIEELKYGIKIIDDIPDFNSMIPYELNFEVKAEQAVPSLDNDYSDSKNNSQKCEMCNRYFNKLIFCKIIDNYGVRYRNICQECVTKYNAELQK